MVGGKDPFKVSGLGKRRVYLVQRWSWRVRKKLWVRVSVRVMFRVSV